MEVNWTWLLAALVIGGLCVAAVILPFAIGALEPSNVILTTGRIG